MFFVVILLFVEHPDPTGSNFERTCSTAYLCLFCYIFDIMPVQRAVFFFLCVCCVKHSFSCDFVIVGVFFSDVQ